jgi:hypothetical protein
MPEPEISGAPVFSTPSDRTLVKHKVPRLGSRAEADAERDGTAVVLEGPYFQS